MTSIQGGPHHGTLRIDSAAPSTGIVRPLNPYGVEASDGGKWEGNGRTCLAECPNQTKDNGGCTSGRLQVHDETVVHPQREAPPMAVQFRGFANASVAAARTN